MTVDVKLIRPTEARELSDKINELYGDEPQTHVDTLFAGIAGLLILGISVDTIRSILDTQLEVGGKLAASLEAAIIEGV